MKQVWSGLDEDAGVGSFKLCSRDARKENRRMKTCGTRWGVGGVVVWQ